MIHVIDADRQGIITLRLVNFRWVFELEFFSWRKKKAVYYISIWGKITIKIEKIGLLNLMPLELILDLFICILY